MAGGSRNWQRGLADSAERQSSVASGHRAVRRPLRTSVIARHAPPELPDPRSARLVGKEPDAQVQQVGVCQRGHIGPVAAEAARRRMFAASTGIRCGAPSASPASNVLPSARPHPCGDPGDDHGDRRPASPAILVAMREDTVARQRGAACRLGAGPAIRTSASGWRASSMSLARRYSWRDRPVSAGAREANSSRVWSLGTSRTVMDALHRHHSRS